MQQDLGHNWIAEFNYMGNHGVHLPVVLPVNQIAPSSDLLLRGQNGTKSLS